jgi:hypothetical protein
MDLRLAGAFYIARLHDAARFVIPRIARVGEHCGKLDITESSE